MYNKYESFRIVPHYVIEVDELRKRLNQYSSGSHSASEDIANWAGAGFLYFMEESRIRDSGIRILMRYSGRYRSSVGDIDGKCL